MRLIRHEEHYAHLIVELVRSARVSLWIATANVKELRIEASVGSRARARGAYVSILSLLDELGQRGVELRLLHAGAPSRAFQQALAMHPRLRKTLAMRRCPRVHMKLIAVDGAKLYLGSANFTGAGLGAKGMGRRNFELGVVVEDDLLLDACQQELDLIWRGAACAGCKLRAVCPKPLDSPGSL